MTELVNTETGEVIAPMTEGEARDFVSWITNLQEIVPRRVIDAYQRRAWIALGYDSWFTMCEAEGIRLKGLSRDERVPMVLEMDQAGMTSRAIAAVTGTNNVTAWRDAHSGVVNETPGPQAGDAGEAAESAPSADDPASPDDEVVDAEIVDDEPGLTDEPGQVSKLTGSNSATPGGQRSQESPEPGSDRVTGADGKSYPKSKPKAAPKPKADSQSDPTPQTNWSRRVQRVSAEIHMENLTDEQVREVQGAAGFLLNYCRGELKTRKDRK